MAQSEQIPAIYVLASDNDCELVAIAAKNNFQLVEKMIDPNGLYLAKKEQDKLSLQGLIENDEVSICVDFVSAEMSHRLKQGHGKNQALAKAIGLNKRSNLKVVDATAGLGRDAFILASLGCDVLMIERAIPIAELLLNGMQRGRENSAIGAIVNRLQLKVEDSANYLQAPLEKPDVVYLDPMFPERKKSAKVKKEMQLLQRLHSIEQDDELLLNAALDCAIQRVVVKRPKGADPYCGKPPTHIIETKKMRYDVYMRLG